MKYILIISFFLISCSNTSKEPVWASDYDSVRIPYYYICDTLRSYAIVNGKLFYSKDTVVGNGCASWTEVRYYPVKEID